MLPCFGAAKWSCCPCLVPHWSRCACFVTLSSHAALVSSHSGECCACFVPLVGSCCACFVPLVGSCCACFVPLVGSCCACFPPLTGHIDMFRPEVRCSGSQSRPDGYGSQRHPTRWIPYPSGCRRRADGLSRLDRGLGGLGGSVWRGEVG